MLEVNHTVKETFFENEVDGNDDDNDRCGLNDDNDDDNVDDSECGGGAVQQVFAQNLEASQCSETTWEHFLPGFLMMIMTMKRIKTMMIKAMMI